MRSLSKIVKALRAKAASTPYPAERELFASKADELAKRTAPVSVFVKKGNNIGLETYLALAVKQYGIRVRDHKRRYSITGDPETISHVVNTYESLRKAVR